MRTIPRLWRLLANPPLMKRALLERSRSASFRTKLDYDALPRPHYAYGTLHAALQAKQLGLPAISVMEFGVAGGAGLRILEAHAEAVERETGVQIAVFGFDTHGGMPPPVDHRDMGYVWAHGLFFPHVDIRTTLTRATFVIGDVRETAPRFFAEHRPPPVGFVSIDVDYYSSTIGAFSLFDAVPEFVLPRVLIYLDDIVGDDHELHGPFTGELAAVEEFNSSHEHRKISSIYALRWKRLIPAQWNDQMFVMHAFDHPLYNRYTNPRWKAGESVAAMPRPEVVIGPAARAMK